jgi:dethiobiotin synthetase
MAAAALGLAPFTLAELVAEACLPEGGLALVEGVGGPRSPLAADGDTVALAGALAAEQVLLVAGAELGAINAVRLAAAAFAPRRPLVLLNRFDPADELHAANLAWLRGVDGFEVLTDIAELAARLAGADRALP